jgi:hypothetical protein
MKRLLLFCLLAQAALAVEQPNKLQLKHTSAFSLDAGERNPFWPIGWKPLAPRASAAAEPSIPASTFSVTSITLDPGAHFAIINGKAMAEGQQFGLQFGSQVYQLKVKSIEDGRVVLQHGAEEIVVGLRRR